MLSELLGSDVPVALPLQRLERVGEHVVDVLYPITGWDLRSCRPTCRPWRTSSKPVPRSIGTSQKSGDC